MHCCVVIGVKWIAEQIKCLYCIWHVANINDALNPFGNVDVALRIAHFNPLGFTLLFAWIQRCVHESIRHFV